VSYYCEHTTTWTTSTNYEKYGPIENWDVSSIDDMSELFYAERNCNPDLAAWDVSGVTDFSYMFYEAESFNQDIDAWDVSKGINFVSDEQVYSMND